MPAFNFHQQFADRVRSGLKRMTIRTDRSDGRVWQIGATVGLFTGMRSTACVCLGRSVLTGATRILIQKGLVTLDGQLLATSSSTVSKLAHEDGFADVEAFMAWFVSEQKPRFCGVLYRWGDLL